MKEEEEDDARCVELQIGYLVTIGTLATTRTTAAIFILVTNVT